MWFVNEMYWYRYWCVYTFIGKINTGGLLISASTIAGTCKFIAATATGGDDESVIDTKDGKTQY